MFTVDESLLRLKEKIEVFPDLAFVLGSGWDKFLDEADIEIEIPYSELFGVGSGVPGHQGKLVIAKFDGKRVACMRGRFHTYEGYTSEEATRPIQVFSKMGLKGIVITAAVGALNEAYDVGDFVILSDMITMLCPSPLIGPQFIDLSSAFDEDWREKAKSICEQEKIPFHQGIYAFTRGPHFETPADKRSLKGMGGDVVGMSTVPETIMSRKLGLKVLGISYVTNLAFVKHEHKDVLAAANAGSERMVKLLTGLVGE